MNENVLTIKEVSDGKQTAWINPYFLPFEVTKGLLDLVLPESELYEAEARLERFAPFIKRAFPETAETDGIIESPLREIGAMKAELENAYNCKIAGKLYLKMDSHLAIAGSIKARGGIYEVLKHAEDLALEHGKISLSENYEKFASPEMREFLSQYKMQVGSTGNLGMSIGIMSAALGFKVTIHMSADAKAWKKELLRSHGVEVLEYDNDYSFAVAQGRENSKNDPYSYFVDDEYSKDLFLGYAVAAIRLKVQLDEKGIVVDEKHPLIVYVPAGVGGAPGGICYGLKRVFGDSAHCFFVEPTLYPSVLLGIATQKHEKANVHDYGLVGNTEADGLACASPSGYVTRLVTNHVSGEFTIDDSVLYDYLRMLYETEDIKIEPSSCAAFEGPRRLLDYENTKAYCEEHGLGADALENATQIAWATGGRLVPEKTFAEYLEKYRK